MPGSSEPTRKGSNDFRKPQGPTADPRDSRGRGAQGRPGAAAVQEVGAGGRWAAGGRAEVILTGLVAHAAQDGAHLHPKVSLSLLQALAHEGHHLVRGEVPSVWGKE